MPSRVMGKCPRVEGTQEVNWSGDKRKSLDGFDFGDSIALRRGGDGVSLLRRAQTGGGLDTGLHASLESPLTAVTGSDSMALGASGPPGQPWSL